jgi:D-ribose pyranose/furanose isomerase RbsD
MGGAIMAKLIPAAERVTRARELIQQARDFPIPPEVGKNDLSYIAGVKDLLRQARDLIKFIPQTAGVSVEMKEEVKKIYEEIEKANRETLYSA